MTDPTGTEGLLRSLAPRVLGAVVRRFGDFARSEDAVQEALIAATEQWPSEGVPSEPLNWLIRVASRRRLDLQRSDDARRRREQLATALAPPPVRIAEDDDTLIIIFLCCHPALSPTTAVALTLRAVGGLTTREIAAAYLVPEATMAQRISRAKQQIRAAGARFALPTGAERVERLASVQRVLYLIFNEGYASTAGSELARPDLSGEAIRLARMLHTELSDDSEVAGLLALMLLTEARRPARTGPGGELIPLEEQDRTRWDSALIDEGTALIRAVFPAGPVGEYQLQAAIAAVHDNAERAELTDWPEILALYTALQRATGNPMVSLNRAVALAMVAGPAAGLAALDGLRPALERHHRWHAVRAHLLERSGATEEAATEFGNAASATTNRPEQHYLAGRASRLRSRTNKVTATTTPAATRAAAAVEPERG